MGFIPVKHPRSHLVVRGIGHWAYHGYGFNVFFKWQDIAVVLQKNGRFYSCFLRFGKVFFRIQNGRFALVYIRILEQSQTELYPKDVTYRIVDGFFLYFPFGDQRFEVLYVGVAYHFHINTRIYGL